MIAFLQPFGLSTPTGGARILRALLEPAPAPFFSVCTALHPPPPTRVGEERWLPRRPRLGRVERSRFARFLGAVDDWCNPCFQRRLAAWLRERRATAVHCVAQNHDFWSVFEIARNLELPYVLTIHDDLRHSLNRRPEKERTLRRFQEVWTQAAARTVISDQMGQEYCRLYGERPHQVITDGVAVVPAAARPRTGRRLYYMGSMAHSYQANFDRLFEAMARLRSRDASLEMTLRGSALGSQPSDVPLTVLPWSSESEVARDFDQVDANYLPLPFGYEAWTRFSLPTKVVTYLGSGLPILYHGPRDSAVGLLLAAHDAAVIVDSLDAGAVSRGLDELAARRSELASNALALARARFQLGDQRARFWRLFGVDAAAFGAASASPASA